MVRPSTSRFAEVPRRLRYREIRCFCVEPRNARPFIQASGLPAVTRRRDAQISTQSALHLSAIRYPPDRSLAAPRVHSCWWASRAAPDGEEGSGGDLQASMQQPTASAAPGLPASAERHSDLPPEPCLAHRHYLHASEARLPLPRSRSRRLPRTIVSWTQNRDRLGSTRRYKHRLPALLYLPNSFDTPGQSVTLRTKAAVRSQEARRPPCAVRHFSAKPSPSTSRIRAIMGGWSRMIREAVYN